MLKHVGRLATAVALPLAPVTGAGAAELKISSSTGVQATLEELAPKFEQASGHKLASLPTTGKFDLARRKPRRLDRA